MSRIKSLDVLRTLIIIDLMTGFHYGNSQHMPHALEHAVWEGCTLADLVFPGFIIMMCFLVPMLVNSKLEHGLSQRNVVFYGFKKFIMLIFIGLFLNLFPDFNFDTFRIPGVLQRNGIIFFGAILLYLIIRKITKNSLKQIYILSALFIFILIGYYLIGKPYNFLGLQEKFDTFFFSGHLYAPNYDPEGIISTIGAFATGIIAMILGILKSTKELNEKFKASLITVVGIIFIILAFLLSPYMPIVKRIWTSTYVLLSGGYIFVVYGILYFVIDIYNIYKPKSFINILSKYSLGIYTVGFLSATIISRLKINGMVAQKYISDIILNPIFGDYDFYVYWLSSVVIFYLFFLAYDKIKYSFKKLRGN